MSCITVHHHSLSPKLIYACPICNHHFVSSSELVNHQERTNMCRVEAGGSGVSQQNTPSQPVSSHHSNSETKRKSFRVEADGSGVIRQQNTPSQPVSSHHSNSETKRKSVRWRTCQQDFQSFVDLYNHRMIDHMQSGGNAASFQPLP